MTPRHRTASLGLLLASLLAACSSGSAPAGPVAPPPLDPAKPDDTLMIRALAAFKAAGVAASEGRALLTADPVANAAAAQARFDVAIAGDLEARTLFDQLVALYPASLRVPQATVMGGRCSYELGTLDPPNEVAHFSDARTRLAGYAASWPSGWDGHSAAYFLGRARYRLASLATQTDDFAAARADFRRSLALGPAGLYADNALYYVGRCSYELAWPVISGIKPLPADPAFASTKVLLDEAQAAFLELLRRFPASSYTDNAIYYLGRSYLDEPTDDAVSTVERLANLDLAAARFGEVIALPASIYADGARYWRGRTRYAMSFHRPAAAELAAALADFQAVLPTSSYKDNAMAYEVRVHARGRDCVAAQAAMAALLAAYPASTWITSTQAYLVNAGC